MKSDSHPVPGGHLRAALIGALIDDTLTAAGMPSRRSHAQSPRESRRPAPPRLDRRRRRRKTTAT